MNEALNIFSYEEGNLLIRLTIAHLLSDFVLQNRKMVENKKWFSTYMFLHIALVYVCSALLTGWWLSCCIIAVIHYIIDGIKIEIQRREAVGVAELFLADQLLHIVTLI